MNSLFFFDLLTNKKTEEELLAALPLPFQKHCLEHTFPKERMRSLLAWNGLVQELKKRNIDPRDVDIKYGKAGKPEIDGFYFNIAHSGDLSVLLISDEECGVDIEVIEDTGKNIQRLASRFLGPKEKAEFDVSKNPLSTFLCFWTKKEAYGKKSGVGITDLAMLKKDVPDSVVSKIVKDSGKKTYWLSYQL